jgi:hypothetical protein
MDDNMDPIAEVEVLAVELTPEQMEELEQEAEKLEQEKQDMLSGLAQEISAKYRERSGRRSSKEREWIESTRLYLGSLSANGTTENKSYPFQQSQGDNRPRHNVVKSKCDVAIATLYQAQFAGGDDSWNIRPTPSPEGNPEMVKEAARNMQAEIKDQLEEEKFGPKSRSAMYNRVVLGTGILKGPSPATSAKLSYTMVDDGTGNMTTIPTYTTRNRPVLFSVNPWMLFPDDTVNDIRDAQDVIELHPMSKLQIHKLKKNPGFFSEAVDSLLQMEPESFANETFAEYSTLTNSGTNFLRDKYAVLEYHGPISVDQLGAMGIEPSYDSLGDMYYGEVWSCQGIVIRAELEAISGLYQHPYKACPWESDPNSIFGFSLPQCIKDPQRIAQVTLDMMLENASISSGPIAILNKMMVEAPDGDYSLLPNKVFTTTDYDAQSVDQIMKFLTVPNMTSQLFPILNFAREVAQEESSMPLLANSLQSAQVGSDSATGLALIQQNMTTVSDYKNEQWDDMIVEPLIEQMYHWNMQYNPRPDIIGDFDIDVRTSSEYRNKQLAVRDVEKLSVEAAQNPELQKWLNMGNLTQVRLSMMHLPAIDIVKSQEQVQQEEEAAAQNPPPPDPALLKVQVEQERLGVEKMKLELEAQKMQFEMQFQQRREEMNHAERMGANHMRELEVQARMAESMAQREIELIKLAQKDDENGKWAMIELQKSQLQSDTQKFQAELNAQTKFRDQAIKAAELSYAERHGKGV